MHWSITRALHLNNLLQQEHHTYVFHNNKYLFENTYRKPIYLTCCSLGEDSYRYTTTKLGISQIRWDSLWHGTTIWCQTIVSQLPNLWYEKKIVYKTSIMALTYFSVRGPLRYGKCYITHRQAFACTCTMTCRPTMIPFELPGCLDTHLGKCATFLNYRFLHKDSSCIYLLNDCW